MLFKEETKRLILKVENEEHAQAVTDFYLTNKDYFLPFEPQRLPSFCTLNYQEKMLAYEKRLTLEGTTLRYYLYAKDEPEVMIGTVNLSNIMHGAFCRATIGYKIDRSHTGNGYATEAVKKLLDIADSELNLHRIEAQVVPENVPSIRILEHAGFEMEGISKSAVRINNHWVDLFHYAKIL